MSARPHFRILGIPVRIEPLFWLATVFLAYGLGDARLIIMWVAVVLVSILVHELGHAIALKLFGQSSSIVLHGFGGLTFSQRRLSRFRSIVVSLAGPFAALALLGLPALWLRDSDMGFDLFREYATSDAVFGFWPIVVFAAYVNIWWSLANLLPIRPLDGGNVLTEIIGIQKARIVSVAVGAGAAWWAYTNTNDDFRFAAFFAGFLVFINLSEYRRDAQGSRAPSAFDVDGPPVPGGGGTRPGQAGPAIAPTTRPPRRGGRPTAPPGPARNRPPMAPAPAPDPSAGLDPATAESFAWNLLRRGDARSARRTLARTTGPVGPFVVATTDLAAGGPLDDLVAAYLANPSGPSNLVPAVVADETGALDTLVRRLLDAGHAGREPVRSIQTHLQYAERFAASARTGEALHAVDGPARAQTAFDVACAWSRAGEPERGLTWIARAIDDGFGATGLLDRETDLDAVRAHPDWQATRNRLP